MVAAVCVAVLTVLAVLVLLRGPVGSGWLMGVLAGAGVVRKRVFVAVAGWWVVMWGAGRAKLMSG